IGTAVVTPLFADNAAAKPANPGAPSQLALTDPDSSTLVPASSPRFGGDYMLDSQGDQQQVYVDDPGTAAQTLSVLALSQAVDDTAFARGGHGTLFVTDGSNGTVDAVTGPFHAGDAFVAVTPCNANTAPATCPTSPVNYLGSLNLRTGTVSALHVVGPAVQAQGMVYVGDHDPSDEG
nr:hypothetical protein [Actinomycetota bacterium]